MSTFFAKYPPQGGGGVTTLNGLSGAVILAAGVGISITPSGNTLTIAATGGGGTVTAVTASSPLSSTGGTTPNISIQQATTLQDGYLSSTDFNTFNNKQPAGSYITALTGDATATGPGSAALTLATVNSNVGSFGTASAVGSFTVNAKGLITAASNTSIQIAESQVTNLVSDLAGKQPLLTVGNLTDVGTDGIVITGGTGAVIGTGTSIAQHVADATHNGYLSSTDWNTFNTAASGALTAITGDVTATGPGVASSLVNSVGGKTAAQIASTVANNTTDVTIGTANGLSLVGQALSLGLSSTSTTGALSSTDWNTFNGKQAAGNYITALTGDATASGPGSAALTLATVNGNVGTFTNATITVNAKGLITAASSGATTTAARVATYYRSSNFSASATTPINFDTQIVDTNSQVTTSPTAWKFTAAITGCYEVNLFAYSNDTDINLYIYKNGSAYAFIANSTQSSQASPGTGGITIPLNATDFIDIRPDAGATITGGALATTRHAYISINFIGT